MFRQKRRSFMKKLIAILMCAVILFSLGACSGGNGDGENTPPVSTSEADTSTPDTTKEKTDEAQIARGTISGDVYTNDFVGITFTKPTEWSYLTDKEISETVNIGQNALDLSVIEKALTETATVYDMATRDDYGNSVMVCYENTMLTALREITIDEYEQNVKVNLESITEIDYEFQSSEDISLGDTSFRRIIFSATVNDVEMTQAYYAKVMGKYVITFIVTAVTEDVKAIEAMFTK